MGVGGRVVGTCDVAGLEVDVEVARVEAGADVGADVGAAVVAGVWLEAAANAGRYATPFWYLPLGNWNVEFQMSLHGSFQQ